MTKTILCQHPLNFGILSASSALRNSTGMVKTRSSSVPAELRKSTATITSKPPRCPQNFEIQLEQETHIWQKMLNQKNQNHTDTTLITSSNLVTVLRIVQPNFPQDDRPRRATTSLKFIPLGPPRASTTAALNFPLALKSKKTKD